jgi:hypothetical protein
MGMIHISKRHNTQKIVSFFYLKCKENAIDTTIGYGRTTGGLKKLDIWKITGTLPTTLCYALFTSFTA